MGGLESVGLHSTASDCWAEIDIKGSSGGFGVVAASSLITRATSAHSATAKINTPMTMSDISVGSSIL